MIQIKSSVFRLGEKENLSIALATVRFYFEASVEKKQILMCHYMIGMALIPIYA